MCGYRVIGCGMGIAMSGWMAIGRANRFISDMNVTTSMIVMGIMTNIATGIIRENAVEPSAQMKNGR